MKEAATAALIQAAVAFAAHVEKMMNSEPDPGIDSASLRSLSWNFYKVYGGYGTEEE
jgi:hypothetical protein